MKSELAERLCQTVRIALLRLEAAGASAHLTDALGALNGLMEIIDSHCERIAELEALVPEDREP